MDPVRKMESTGDGSASCVATSGPVYHKKPEPGPHRPGPFTHLYLWSSDWTVVTFLFLPVFCLYCFPVKTLQCLTGRKGCQAPQYDQPCLEGLAICTRPSDRLLPCYVGTRDHLPWVASVILSTSLALADTHLQMRAGPPIHGW